VFIMGRWLPDAQGRLESAAMELYAERGFEQTTALEIAERAGVTERTFFRYYADKREVLFQGSSELVRQILESMRAADPRLRPIDIVIGALEAAGEFFSDRGHSQARAAIISSNPSLQERELLKMLRLAQAVAEQLRELGVKDPGATLAAETGITVFRVAFDTWVAGTGADDYVGCVRDVAAQLGDVTPSAAPR
jgi:AcrR family transcriptional regulator